MRKNMLNVIKRFIPCISLLILFSFAMKAECDNSEDDWRDNMVNLIYSPRYFGPSAFPIPELKTGKPLTEFEFEARGEYHYYAGDKTTDLFTRALIPIVKGRAGIEVSLVVVEKYKMTPETRDERHAAELESPISYNGDVVVSAFFQVLNSDKWADAMIRLTLKSASGGRLCDARFTDAAAYWFDGIIGRDLLKSADGMASLRAQVMGGFYCWMTNSMKHRQNDAILFGSGITGNYKHFTLSSDISGFYGYKQNGDRPTIFRNNLKFEFKKNILSLRYNHGIHDYLYDTYSIGYIRCF